MQALGDAREATRDPPRTVPTPPVRLECPGVRAPRHLLALLTSAALLAAPATALGQSGAGDQQYSDPLAGTTTGSTTTSSSGSSGSSGSGSSEGTQLGQAPPTTGGSTTTATTPTGSSSSSLPNTGSDPRVLGLLGLALLLAGTGLRLRTRDGRI